MILSFGKRISVPHDTHFSVASSRCGSGSDNHSAAAAPQLGQLNSAIDEPRIIRNRPPSETALRDNESPPASEYGQFPNSGFKSLEVGSLGRIQREHSATETAEVGLHRVNSTTD